MTIGVFDGVHRGHVHLISELSKRAKAEKRSSIVLTFKLHPSHVLDPNFEPCYLTTLEERLRLLRQLAVDEVVPVTFDIDLSRLKARAFVELLQTQLGMRELVVGPDFAMGHRREGDVATLRNLGKDMGFGVSVVEPLTEESRVIGSTAIRAALTDGNLETAAKLLGRNFSLPGTVVHGSGRGKGLGFPTANLRPTEGLIVPGDGIYAAWGHVEAGRHMAATSIGTNPTFEDKTRTIEPFLLDFNGDLYDKPLKLEFVRRLRDQVKYEKVEDLQRQVDEDVDQTKKALRARN